MALMEMRFDKRFVFIKRSIQFVGPLKALYTLPPGWLPSKPKITLANLAKVDKFLLAK